MVSEFYDEVIKKKKGDVSLLETRFGKHIVKALESPVKDRWKVKYIMLGISTEK
jgi:hypothetical protein